MSRQKAGTALANVKKQVPMAKSEPKSLLQSALDAIPAETYADSLTKQYPGLLLGILVDAPTKTAVATGKLMLQETLDDVAPRDSLERMLVEQLVFCYHRVLSLATLAKGCGGAKDAIAAHAQCDQAMNAYRRGMLALKEYRSERRAGSAVTVQQLNQAEHQNVTVGVMAQPPEKT